MNQPEVTTKMLRSFGFLMGGVLSVFSVFHFFLILFRKDFLKRKLDPSAESYWEKRETLEIDVEKYEKQY